MADNFINLKKLKEKVRQGTPKYDFNARLHVGEIETFERANGIILPESYKQFLQRFNGGMITRYKWTSYIDMSEFEEEHPSKDSYLFFTLEEISKKYADLKYDKWNMGDDFSGNYPIIPICKMPESKGEFLFVFSHRVLPGESPVFAFVGQPDEKACFQVSDNFNSFLGWLMEYQGFPPVLKTERKKTCQGFMDVNKTGEIAAKVDTDDETIVKTTAAIKLNPDNAWLYCDRGDAYKKNGNNKLALSDFNKAIELDDNQAYYYFQRAQLISDFVSPRKALIDFDYAVKLEPGNKLYLWGRAHVFYTLGKYQKALLDCNKVLEQDGNLVLALKTRTLIYMALGEAEKAEADLFLIDRISSNNPKNE